MLIKRSLALLLAIVFTVSFTAPVIAAPPGMSYRKSYVLDGIILMKIQAGDETHTVAVHKTLIEGTGYLNRQEDIYLNDRSISVSSNSDWLAAGSSSDGLTVVSTIELNEDLTGSPAEGARQVFAISVTANPGQAGHLSQEMSAAQAVYAEENNTFIIDQRANVSDGTMKRFIDLVCPVSGAYLFEDSEIRGSADVTDALQLADDENNTELEEVQALPPEDSNLQEDQACNMESVLFEKTVLLGTGFEEIDLPRVCSLTFDLVTINDIQIEWNLLEQDLLYNPDEEGSYIFVGELLLPENIVLPGDIYILCLVHLVR